MHSFGLWILAGAIFWLVAWAYIVVFGRIVHRAGYSRWWLLTMLVPLLNVIMIWVFAFADWPAQASRDRA
jgi:K+-transporting ATPase A subunit